MSDIISWRVWFDVAARKLRFSLFCSTLKLCWFFILKLSDTTQAMSDIVNGISQLRYAVGKKQPLSFVVLRIGHKKETFKQTNGARTMSDIAKTKNRLSQKKRV